MRKRKKEERRKERRKRKKKRLSSSPLRMHAWGEEEEEGLPYAHKCAWGEEEEEAGGEREQERGRAIIGEGEIKRERPSLFFIYFILFSFYVKNYFHNLNF